MSLEFSPITMRWRTKTPNRDARGRLCLYPSAFALGNAASRHFKAPQGEAAGRRFHSLVVNRRNYRRRWNCVVFAIVEVVVAVIVVAVPIVVDAVHDNHPLLLNPFPCT